MERNACPHCGAHLAPRLLRTRPAPGERRWLPLRGELVCPDCGGVLHANPHPMERRLNHGLLALALAMMVTMSAPMAENLRAGTFAVLLLLGAAATAWVETKYLRRRPRYAAKPPRD